jgi:predicted metal-dependent phosphoesterase TrpH
MMKRIKVAIHLHTHHSWDSNLTPAALMAAARRAELDCVAITDHNTIDGALEARCAGTLRVIVGEEVSSADGHLIGLFLERPIPPGLSGEETIAEIHAQGGVVLAPHPFVTLCQNSLQADIWHLAGQLDAVEIFNAQNPLPADDARAAEFARQTGLPAYVGMDAHLRWLPEAYQIMPDFTDSQSFVRSLREAELLASRVGLRYCAVMAFRHIRDRLLPGRLAGCGEKTRPGAVVDAEGPGSPVVQSQRFG